MTGSGITINHLLLPYAFLCLFLFTVGMGLILSTIAVFLRDLFYIYGVIIQLWTYMTPIMYDFAIIPKNLQGVFMFNPLYWFIDFAREIILYNQIPELNTWLYCGGFAIGFLIVGLIVFKKNQDKFIYYA